MTITQVQSCPLVMVGEPGWHDQWLTLINPYGPKIPNY